MWTLLSVTIRKMDSFWEPHVGIIPVSVAEFVRYLRVCFCWLGRGEKVHSKVDLGFNQGGG